MESNKNLYVPDVHFELIPIKNLVSNQEYQRNLSLQHVKRAAKNFDIHQINPVKVSRRADRNFVFNGQHTIEIVAEVSGSRDTPVWCMVYDNLNYTEEADIFANQMTYVKKLSPIEIFKANIEAGNDKQLTIKELVESYGLRIASTSTPGGICAVSSLEYIFDQYGFHTLDRTIRLCVGAWEGIPKSLSANILKAIARLVFVYDDALKDDIFKEKLGVMSIKELTRSAKEIRSGSLGYAEIMVITYNKKLKGGALQREKLYFEKGRKPKRIKTAEEYEHEAEKLEAINKEQHITNQVDNVENSQLEIFGDVL
jgi:hypothetical protein